MFSLKKKGGEEVIYNNNFCLKYATMYLKNFMFVKVLKIVNAVAFSFLIQKQIINKIEHY